jgi:hypothetical protein
MAGNLSQIDDMKIHYTTLAAARIATPKFDKTLASCVKEAVAMIGKDKFASAVGNKTYIKLQKAA